MASLASKVTLLVSSLLSGGIIYYVHYQQAEDRVQLRKGIELEGERREEQKRINLVRLQQQADLTKAYKTAAEKDSKDCSPQILTTRCPNKFIQEFSKKYLLNVTKSEKTCESLFTL